MEFWDYGCRLFCIMNDKNHNAFLELLRAGLWEKNIQLAQYKSIDFKEVYRLAQEQSVVGLVAAGLEHVTDIRIPKKEALDFVGDTLQIEQRNAAMIFFIAALMNRLREYDILLS